ncbi:MAG: citrate/2-methylcitrate synthase [Clostridiales bacterium]|nr:citrate/2-methylcitrate synthase [Clostridiales bacterium]
MGTLKERIIGTAHFIAEKNPKQAPTNSEEAFLNNAAQDLKESGKIPEELYIKHDVKRGLRNANGTGVVVGLTRIGDVIGYKMDSDGNKIPVPGELYYRGYSVKDLVTSCIKEDRFGFEEATYLLLLGELPTAEELDTFKKILGMHRELPANFARDMILTAPSNNIMNKLARSILALYSYDDNPDDISVNNVLRQSVALIGFFPTLISYGYQAKRNYYHQESLHLHHPIPELSTAENILRMLRADGEYTKMEAKLLDLSLVLHAEHGGGNNSTLTTHIVTSAATDTYSAISAAVGSLKGPRHGGANISVINMINDLKENVKDITDKAEIEQYLRAILECKANDGTGLIYGLGHAIYTISDPRAIILKTMAKKLAESKGLENEFALYEYIEKIAPKLYSEKTGKDVNMPANVDLYSGFVYSALNIPIDIATPLFATARVAGWCAHRLEEITGGGKLMRPAYDSIQPLRSYVPINKRK